MVKDRKVRGVLSTQNHWRTGHFNDNGLFWAEIKKPLKKVAFNILYGSNPIVCSTNH